MFDSVLSRIRDSCQDGYPIFVQVLNKLITKYGVKADRCRVLVATSIDVNTRLVQSLDKDLAQVWLMGGILMVDVWVLFAGGGC